MPSTDPDGTRPADSLRRETENRRRWDALALGLCLLGLLVAIVLGILSDGFYMDDDITHYQYAREGMSDVHLLLDRWGRPGYTVPAAPIARYLGVPWLRVFSAVQTALAAWFAYLLGRRILGVCLFAALIPLLVWVQPLTLRLAYTTLTETPALLYLTAGFWMVHRGWSVSGCAVTSFAFIAREETFPLAVIPALVVLFDCWRRCSGSLPRVVGSVRVWGSWLALLLGPALYVLAALAVDLPPERSPLGIFTRRYTTEYGSGPILWYPAIWTEQASLGLVVLCFTGAVCLGRRAWAVTAFVFGLVGLHGMIFSLGLFASGGYARFLVPISGFTAILAAGGIRGLLAERSPRVAVAACAGLCIWIAALLLSFNEYLAGLWKAMLAAMAVLGLAGVLLVVRYRRQGSVTTRVSRLAFCLLGVLVVGQGLATTRPLSLRSQPVDRAICMAAETLEPRLGPTDVLLTQHCLVKYLLPRAKHCFGLEESVKAWQAADEGSRFFWDSKYCWKPHELQASQEFQALLERTGQREIERFDAEAGAVVYRKNSPPPDMP